MDNDSKLLLAKANDLIRLRDLRNIPKFSAFLSPSEATAIEAYVKAPNCLFYGGYFEAERRIFAALPDYISDAFSEFPISVLKIEYRKVDSLSHRDFLGSFMSTGITRDSIGDIIVSDGLALAFVTTDIADYLAKQITKIGKVGVKVNVVETSKIEDSFPQVKTIPLNFTVSSLRLDAVLSGLIGCSRTKAESYIKDGSVFVNSFEVTKLTKLIKSGDFVTLRGTGKFLISDCSSVSKKGRHIVEAEKYI